MKDIPCITILFVYDIKAFSVNGLVGILRCNGTPRSVILGDVVDNTNIQLWSIEKPIIRETEDERTNDSALL